MFLVSTAWEKRTTSFLEAEDLPWKRTIPFATRASYTRKFVYNKNKHVKQYYTSSYMQLEHLLMLSCDVSVSPPSGRSLLPRSGDGDHMHVLGTRREKFLARGGS